MQNSARDVVGVKGWRYSCGGGQEVKGVCRVAGSNGGRGQELVHLIMPAWGPLMAYTHSRSHS